MPRELDDSMRFILETFRKDIDLMDEKWNQYLVTAIRQEEIQKNLAVKVDELTRILTKDNGKPSVLTQLNTLSDDVKKISHAVGVKSPKEAKVERWKTVGQIAAATAAVAPGILAFIHSFM